MNKITIIQPRAMAIIHEGSERKAFGGAEMQSVYLVMLLNSRYPVNFIIQKTNRLLKEKFKTIKTQYTYSETTISVRYLRFLYPRLYYDIKALWKSNAEFYYQRGPSELTGTTGIFCKLFKRKFIYAISGNGEIKDLKEKLKNPFAKFLYKRGLELSDVIVCQTHTQKQLLCDRLRGKAIVINNIFPSLFMEKKPTPPQHILNVGGLRPLKRQTFFLRLAKNFIHEKFICIGGGKDNYANTLFEKGKSIQNIKMTGHLPHEKVQEFIKQAYCLVNCSDNEGFPNVFLEAWANKIPVISWGFDPDGIISSYSLGFVVEGMDELKKAVNIYLKRPDIRKRHGENGKNYVDKFHSNRSILNEFSKLLE